MYIERVGAVGPVAAGDQLNIHVGGHGSTGKIATYMGGVNGVVEDPQQVKGDDPYDRKQNKANDGQAGDFGYGTGLTTLRTQRLVGMIILYAALHRARGGGGVGEVGVHICWAGWIPPEGELRKWNMATALADSLGVKVRTRKGVLVVFTNLWTGAPWFTGGGPIVDVEPK